MEKENLKKIQKLTDLPTVELIKTLSTLDLKLVFSTSFGKEDQVLTDLIANNNPAIDLFTLDTGRLFSETYDVFNRTIKKYKRSIQTFYPQAAPLQKMVTEDGPYSFYESIENRKQCCAIRKIEPLKRAIKGYDVWITGLRKEQSNNRGQLEMVEWDESNNIIKIHPLLNWTEKEMDAVIDANNIPVNILHKKGFKSIGCQPCTRAIEEGEEERAGRWWWEQSKKECGLHT
ncbi:phosphoadenylyl-sulfate reductase [Crocinitomix catalasitica]|uniref:phosphoadenylyl-sulfate reductase n=1 Tax=Crocinitomix catalasitica TaxID=184607 RepID=UPI000489CF3E|nr:phosphoadenylyl-sulfate reductase [Crocinitomix catalasitica]